MHCVELRIVNEGTCKMLFTCQVEAEDGLLLDDDALIGETADQVVADAGLDYRVVRVGRDYELDVAFAYVVPIVV